MSIPIRDNEYETTVAFLKHLAEVITTDRENYTYSTNYNSIKVYNRYGNLILDIPSSSLEERNTIISVYDYYGEWSTIQSLVENGTLRASNQALGSSRAFPRLEYKYYYSQAEQFQQMTLHDDVLPYDSTWDINTIINSIIEDITFWCGGFESREYYEETYDD